MNQYKLRLAKDQRIVFLDYLRIFAFGSVIIGHTYFESLNALTQNPNLPQVVRLCIQSLLPLFYAGGAGVVVFFLVSGYIITHVLQSENAVEFIIKRIFRIYPLYIFAVIVEISLSAPFYIQYPEAIPIHLPQWVAQILLIGDFFNATWALGGVEWTLRLEILFYLFMMILRCFNILPGKQNFLPYILIFVTLLLTWLPPFPYWSPWTYGYLGIYAPFFFLGIMIYLTEKKHAHISVLFLFICILFYTYYNQISALQPRWLGHHFAAIAAIIFLLAWYFKEKFIAGIPVRTLSDLTYAAYLFHAWLHSYIQHSVINIIHNTFLAELISLLLFLGICFCASRYIDNPAINLGKFLATKVSLKGSTGPPK